ncbi:MAG: RsmG family class I SAM-dependent methyltransferase [bacterium]
MLYNIPDTGSPVFQRLALKLAQVGRSHSYVGLTDPDEVMDRLILGSLAVRPLLSAGRPIMDIGTGVGIPSLPLAIADPARPIIAVEPREECISLLHWLLSFINNTHVRTHCSTLQNIPLHCIPPAQVVARSSLDWDELLMDDTSRYPYVRWSGPNVPEPPDREGWVHRTINCTHSLVYQSFDWWGPREMFHVKQHLWDSLDWLSVDPEHS